MKKCLYFLLIALCLTSMSACAVRLTESSSGDYPAVIMVEGEIYQLGSECLELPDLVAEGYTTGYTDTYPEEDGVCNFNREESMPYAFYQGELVVYYEDSWRVFSYEDDLKRETAVIAEIGDDILLVGDSVGLCFAEYGDLSLPESLSVGDRVQFFWNGMVAESYPGQIGGIASLSILDEGRDVLGLYREAHTILVNADAALGSNITELALDLSQVSSLSEGEKEAFCYLISCDTGVFDCYLATREGLSESGKITFAGDEESFQSFAGGMLYRFQEVEEREDGFQFRMEKYTSSLGALGYSDCEASFDEDGAYTLTLPSMMWIS